MAYPTSLDTYTVVAGTTLLTDVDHAGFHNSLGSAVVAVETKIGLSSSTPAANQALIGSGAGTSGWSGTWNGATLGTPSITGGTINSSVIGTPSITGGTLNNSTVGTPAITGGTLNNTTIGTPAIAGGTANGMTIGTPNVNGSVYNSSGTLPVIFGNAITPAYGSLTMSAGGTTVVNASSAQVWYCVLGTAAGNRTIDTPLYPTAFQPLTFAIKASGSANGTIVWGTAFQISQDSGTPALGTGTSWNYFAWRYNPVSTKWDNQGNVKNLV